MKDGFTRLAKKEGYRARSAYKLKQINRRFDIIREGYDVLDLGCFPGGWLIAAREMSVSGRVVGIDLEDIEPVEGVDFFRCDVREANKRIRGRFDVVLSDMAPKTTGNRSLDVGRSVGLAESALNVAVRKLKRGGNFLCKVFQGGETDDFISEVRKYFRKVKCFKPEASKKRSMEMYVVALGFKA